MRALLALFLALACGQAFAQPQAPYGPQTLGVRYPAINTWSPTFNAADTSAGAPAAGGSGYVVGDQVTLNDGCATHAVASVVAVNTGAVTQFMLSTRGSCASIPANPVAQLSTGGVGTGATFTLSWVPASAGTTFAPPGAASNGQALLGYNMGAGLQYALGQVGFGYSGCGSGGNNTEGMGGGAGMSGGENSCFGFFPLTQVTTGNFLTATGHNAAGHEVDGLQSAYYGTDAGKWALHNWNFTSMGSNAAKYLWNSRQVNAVGSLAFQGSFATPTVTGAANNGSGLIRLAVTSTAGMTSGDAVFVGGVNGTTEANTGSPTGQATAATPWYINVIDGTHIDLQGSTFTHAWTSGGTVNDFASGFVNQAVLGTANSGGLVQLLIGTTINMFTSETVHVANVGGTTEANGTWVITVVDGNCQVGGGGGAAGACRVTLQGSTFSNAWTSGGQITNLFGPRNSSAWGYQTLGGSSLTGSIFSVNCFGPQSCGAVKMLGNSTIIGTSVGTTTLGTTGGNINVILIGDDSSTDVAAATTVNTVAIGQGNKVGSNSVDVGFRNDLNNTTGFGNVKVGYLAGSKTTSGFNIVAVGANTVSTTLQTGHDDLILGTTAGCDTPASSTSNYIALCAGSTPVFAVSGSATPATAIGMASGAFQIGSITALTVAGGELGLTKVAASGTAPGAAGVKLSAVCGTNAGTAKLIMYAGTSTTPVTVVDNAGTGVTGC